MDVVAVQSNIKNDKQRLNAKLLDIYSESPSSRITTLELTQNVHCIYDALSAAFFLNASDSPSEENSQAIKEYDLLNRLNTPQYGWSKISTVALFEKHFITRFCLYFIAKYSALFALDIQLISIYVSLQSASNCASEVGHAVSPALEAFYFDWSQFNHVTPETVNHLLTDFWVRYTSSETAHQDLSILAITAPLKTLTLKDIKQAYRLKAQKHHPDKGGNSEIFYAIEQAYQRLCRLIHK